MKSIKKFRKILRFYHQQAAYLFFGMLTTVINYGSFIWLIAVFGNQNALTANVISFVLATTFAYLTNKKFVFQSNVWSARQILREGLAFFSTRLFSFGIEEAGLWACIAFLSADKIQWFGINGTVISKIILSGISVILNYFLSKFIVFRKRAGG